MLFTFLLLGVGFLAPTVAAKGGFFQTIGATSTSDRVALITTEAFMGHIASAKYPLMMNRLFGSTKRGVAKEGLFQRLEAPSSDRIKMVQAHGFLGHIVSDKYMYPLEIVKVDRLEALEAFNFPPPLHRALFRILRPRTSRHIFGESSIATTTYLDYDHTITLSQIASMPQLRSFLKPDVTIDPGMTKLPGLIMSELATHCPLLEECEIGHQIDDGEFDKHDLIALIQGCPMLEALGSHNGIGIDSSHGSLLSALREAGGSFDVSIRFRNPLEDVEDVMRSFIRNPGSFTGCLKLFPYTYAANRSEKEKKQDKLDFDLMGIDLMASASAAGFSLSILELDWFD